MKSKPHKKAVPTEKAIGSGIVSLEMLQARARELAALAGRAPSQVDQIDFEQAKRELTTAPGTDRQEAILDALPEEKRWDPVPGSPGRQIPESPSEDEDDEGRSESEQLVEEGVMEAEREQILQAATEAAKHEKDGA